VRREKRRNVARRSTFENANILETFEKRLILFRFKEEEDFNHRNTLGILRIKI